MIKQLRSKSYGHGAFGENESYPPSKFDLEVADMLTKLLDERNVLLDTDDRMRKLVGQLDLYRNCMSYNDSYFGEPPGMLKQTIRQMVKHIDAEDRAAVEQIEDPEKQDIARMVYTLTHEPSEAAKAFYDRITRDSK